MDFLKEIPVDDEIKGKLEQQFKSYLDETTKGLKANNDALLAEKKRLRRQQNKRADKRS